MIRMLWRIRPTLGVMFHCGTKNRRHLIAQRVGFVSIGVLAVPVPAKVALLSSKAASCSGFRQICQFESKIPGIGGVTEADVQIDNPGTNHALDFAVEMLHTLV